MGSTSAGGGSHFRGRPPRVWSDRFIPLRSAMDFDFANYMLTTRDERDNVIGRFGLGYSKLLVETLLKNRSRILEFSPRPPAPPVDGTLPQDRATGAAKKTKTRYINPYPELTFEAPDLLDAYALNLLDWGSRDVLAIALGHTICLWDGSVSELTEVGDEAGPVTSVSWAPDGERIALGLCSSDVQLWDAHSKRLLRTLKGTPGFPILSLSWNNHHTLTTGGMDGMVVDNDMRVRSHVVRTYKGHREKVCGLKWSGSGTQLASGGYDNLVYIWDPSMASRNAPHQNQWLHRFEGHTGAVKALAWCPFQSNLLVSGSGDGWIKFWNIRTGARLNSVDTGHQVSALLWSRNERELLSSHGSFRWQLRLWRYPTMAKIANLSGHTARVLHMTQSPDGCRVASAASDETLSLWRIFGTFEEPPKPARKPGPFTSFNRSHIR